jgi:hypothetical protein
MLTKPWKRIYALSNIHLVVCFACNNVNIELLVWRPLFFAFATFVSNVGS